MSNSNNNSAGLGASAGRRVSQIYQNEQPDENDIIDFDTGNEFASNFNRDIMQ